MTTPFQAIAAQDASSAGIDANIFIRQIQQESGFNQYAKSPAGAEGIAQFMPSTAAGMGINPWDPIASLKAAVQYDANNLRKYNGDWQKTLAAYNAGGGAVDAAVAQYGGSWLSHMPTETQHYVQAILGGQTVATQPFPGTGDPCLGCGPLGSAAYAQCHAALAAKVGPIPSCAQAGIQQNQQQIGQAITDPITGAIAGIFQPFFAALPSFGIHIALFFAALMLVIVGMWILTRGGANK